MDLGVAGSSPVCHPTYREVSGPSADLFFIWLFGASNRRNKPDIRIGVGQIPIGHKRRHGLGAGGSDRGRHRDYFAGNDAQSSAKPDQNVPTPMQIRMKENNFEKASDPAFPITFSTRSAYLKQI